MKKLSYLVLSGLFLTACTQTEVKKDSDTDVKNETTDTISQTISEQIVEEDAEITLNHFEDYAKLDTREKVMKRFGSAHISNGTSWYGEGSTSYPHSIVTNTENGHVIKYLWQDEDSNKINFLEASHKKYNNDFEVISTQSLTSSSGMKLGMPIKDFLAWNDNVEITFSGFAWDFHGNVHEQSNNDSKLAKCGLSITMDDNSGEGLSADFMGDVTLSTNNEAVLNSPILVGQFTYFIPETEK